MVSCLHVVTRKAVELRSTDSRGRLSLHKIWRTEASRRKEKLVKATTSHEAHCKVFEAFIRCSPNIA